MAVITLVSLTAAGDVKDSAAFVKTTLDKTVLVMTSLLYSEHGILLEPRSRGHGLGMVVLGYARCSCPNMDAVS